MQMDRNGRPQEAEIDGYPAEYSWKPNGMINTVKYRGSVHSFFWSGNLLVRYTIRDLSKRKAGDVWEWRYDRNELDMWEKCVHKSRTKALVLAIRNIEDRDWAVRVGRDDVPTGSFGRAINRINPNLVFVPESEESNGYYLEDFHPHELIKNLKFLTPEIIKKGLEGKRTA